MINCESSCRNGVVRLNFHTIKTIHFCNSIIALIQGLLLPSSNLQPNLRLSVTLEKIKDI